MDESLMNEKWAGLVRKVVDTYVAFWQTSVLNAANWRLSDSEATAAALRDVVRIARAGQREVDRVLDQLEAKFLPEKGN